MIAPRSTVLAPLIAGVAWGPDRLDLFRTGNANSDLQHLWWNGPSV
jgi:hypothetical protein